MAALLQPPSSRSEHPQDAARGARRERTAHALLEALDRFVRERLEGFAQGEFEWVDQDHSPLGRRRHLTMVRSGHLPARKIGKKVFVRRANLNSYLESQTVVVASETGGSGAETQEDRVADVAATVLTSVGLRQRKRT